MAEGDLPTGTVTFLFTDIVESTQLWERFPDGMKVALARHDELLRDAIETHGGRIVKTTGDGAYAAFADASEALHGAVAAQQALMAAWPIPETPGEATAPIIRARMGIHTGDAELRQGDYHGTTLNVAARLMSAGHGGQILLSTAAASLAVAPRFRVTLRDLGEHRLKGLSQPERIYQVVVAGLPSAFPPLRSAGAVRGNLPPPLTSFIGRERETAEIHAILAHTRLATLAGTGGSGKTRLALHVAEEEQARYPDGVWLVELAALEDDTQLAREIAHAFQLEEQPHVSAVEQLTEFLTDRRLLLVMDNCEHLLAGCASLIASLLRACPHITIAATSREVLNIAGESVYDVGALSLPTGGAEGAMASILQSDAVRLFVERAQAAKPTFELDDHNAPAVAAIVNHLDGIPLGIELAAARVRMFTPQQIAERLSDRFRLLTGGSRDVLPRQQTLRALIDWSYDLLSEAEQQVFRRLGVFSGGWTFEAAEALAPEADLFDVLPSLINKSLVQVLETGEETRYRYLETIRQYALARLEEMGETEAVMGEFLDYLCTMSERWYERFRQAQRVETVRQMDDEVDNVRTALEWGIAANPAQAARLVSNLWIYWFLKSRYHETKTIYDALARRLGPTAEALAPAERGLFLVGYASVVWQLGELAHMADLSRESLRVYEQLGDDEGMSLSYHHLAAAGTDEDEAAGEADVQAAVAHARHANSPWALGIALNNLANRRFDSGRLAEAEALVLEMLEDSGAVPQWSHLYDLNLLAEIEARRGQYTAAHDHNVQALALARDFGDQRMVGQIQLDLARQGLAAGDLDEAQAWAEGAMLALREIGRRAAAGEAQTLRDEIRARRAAESV